MTDLSPARTSVLAIGLEAYAYGAPMDLPGAAEHAVRFARWAHDRGVPLERIRLGCSWLDPATTVETRLPGAIAVDTSNDKLWTTLVDLMDEGGDLLLLYWCGHGVSAEGLSRVLFTSNASEQIKFNIAVDAMRRLLGSAQGVGFKQQILLIDSCANAYEQLGFAAGLPPGDIGPGLAQREVPQFVYFATDMGQVADYDRGAGEAAFSTEVLRYLEDVSGAEFPPDLDAVKAHVDAVFKARADQPGVRQQPVVLDIKAVGGDRSRVTYFAAPTTGTLQPSQVRHLTTVVVGSTLLATEVARVAAASALATMDGQGAASLDDAVSNAFATGHGEWVITALRDLTGPNDEDATELAKIADIWMRQERIAPLTSELGRVSLDDVRAAVQRALPPGATHRAVGLVDALDAAAAQGLQREPGTALYRLVAMLEHRVHRRVRDDWFDLDADQLASLRDSAPGWLASAQTRLVLDLRSGGAPAGVTCWPQAVLAHVRRPVAGELHWEPAVVFACDQSLESVQSAVQDALDWTYEMIDSTFTVGLVVPRTLHPSWPETWPLLQDGLASVPLGVEHPTVLHSAERLAGRPVTRNRWRARATAVRSALAIGAPAISWVDAGRRADAPAIRALAAEMTASLLGLEFAPDQPSADPSQDPILATVWAGAPYVLWTDTEPEAWDDVKAGVDALIASGSFDELPGRLHTMRRASPELAQAWLRVLWDDPDLLPPSVALRGAGSLAAAGSQRAGGSPDE